MPNPSPVVANSNSGNFTTGTSVTVSSTGSVTAGNLMVCVLTVGGASAPSALSPPDGTWTTFLSTTANTGSGLIVTAVFYKRATATGSFSGSFSWTTTATSGAWGFFVVNQPGASLVDGAVATSQNASGTKTSPSVTPGTGNVNDTLIGAIIGAVVGTDSITQPAGMTSLVNIAGSSTQPFFSIASLGLAGSGATGAKTWTIPTSRTCLGVSFLIQQGPVYDFTTSEPLRPARGSLTARRAATRGKSEFAVFRVPVVPWGEGQAWQPFRTMRVAQRGNAAGGRVQFSAFNPFVPLGWEAVPAPSFHVRRFVVTPPTNPDDVFVFTPTFRFSPTDMPSQPARPPRRLVGWPDFGEDGNEATLVNWQNAGWETQAVQPPHRRTEKFGAIVMHEDGTESPLAFWQNGGWEVQPVHPPAKPARRIVGWPDFNEDANEAPYLNWINAGWAVEPPQPPHPRRERAAPLVRGDDGTQAAFANFLALGWPVLPFQPSHPRPERSAAIARGADGIEGVQQAFVAYGWFVPQPQPPHPRPERSGGLALGDPGNEATFVLVPPPITWGFEPSMPLPGWRRKVLVTAEDVVASRFAVFRPVGFESPWLPLPRRRPVQPAPWDDGTEARFSVFRPFGFEAPWQPARRRATPILDSDGDVQARTAAPVWGWAAVPDHLARAFRRSGFFTPFPGQPEAPASVPAWGWETLPILSTRARRAPLRPHEASEFEVARAAATAVWGWDGLPNLLRPRRFQQGAALSWGAFDLNPVRIVYPNLSFALDRALWSAASFDSTSCVSEGFDAALFSCAAAESIDGTQQGMGTYEIDTALQITGTFANSLTGQAADPSATTLFLRDPTGAVQTITGSSLTKVATGQYTYTFTPLVHGTWTYKWQGVGDVVATSPDTIFTVKPSALIAG